MRRLRLSRTAWYLAAILAAKPAIAIESIPPVVAVAVLDHAVEKGQILSTADFASDTIGIAPSQARGALRIRDATGMEATRRLQPGAVVRESDIIRPQLVRRGEPVVISIRDRALVITTSGRALSGGAAGDPVRVVTLSTNRTLDGTVEGSGMVRVISN